MVYDVVIKGAGTIGMSAGYYLSKKDIKVAVIDKHNLPHSDGFHHGGTRIIRHAHSAGSPYVEMSLRASELWKELEHESKEKHFYNTVVLNIGIKNLKFLNKIIDTSEHFSLPIETLSAIEINNRWPGFNLKDNLIGCFTK